MELGLDAALQPLILSLLTPFRGLTLMRDRDRRRVAENSLKNNNLGRLSFRANRVLAEGRKHEGFGEKQSSNWLEQLDKFIFFLLVPLIRANHVINPVFALSFLSNILLHAKTPLC